MNQNLKSTRLPMNLKKVFCQLERAMYKQEVAASVRFNSS